VSDDKIIKLELGDVGFIGKIWNVISTKNYFIVNDRYLYDKRDQTYVTLGYFSNVYGVGNVVSAIDFNQANIYEDNGNFNLLSKIHYDVLYCGTLCNNLYIANTGDVFKIHNIYTGRLIGKIPNSTIMSNISSNGFKYLIYDSKHKYII